MSWFSKKNDVPELPKAMSLPKLPGDSKRQNMLPSMKSEKDGKMGNMMVKSAVTDSEMHLAPNNMPGDFHYDEDSQMDHKKEVFVKLDRFTHAQKTFEQMKSKMGEIESLVNKAKHLNEREKTELESWNNELEAIKEKVADIDKEVFNQI